MAATLATLSTAIARRLRVWRDGRNGIRARQGNFNLTVEVMRFTKQCLLVHCAVSAISEKVLADVCLIAALMALTSVYSIWHNGRLSRYLERTE